MNDMDVHRFNRVLQSVAGGSALLLIATSGVAGHLCCKEPSRPHVSAADAANWGFHQTCWQRFPPVPACNPELNCWSNNVPDSAVSGYPEFYVPQNPAAAFPNNPEVTPPLLPPSHSGMYQN